MIEQYFMIKDKMAKHPKKPNDRTSIVVVQPATGCLLKNTTSVYTTVKRENAIITSVKANDTFPATSVKMMKLSTATEVSSVRFRCGTSEWASNPGGGGGKLCDQASDRSWHKRLSGTAAKHSFA